MTAQPSMGAMPDDHAPEAPAATASPPPPPAAHSAAPSPIPSILVAVALAGAGITALARSRWRFGPGLRIGRLGQPSELTMALGGVILLVGAYHAVVYGLGIHGFRLPIWAVALAGPLIIAASFGMDVLDNRHADGGRE